MITLSFVIPVYNEEKRLDNTFKALRELRIPHGTQLKEVIFVNDGSTDTSALRIMKYESGIKKKSIIPFSKFVIQTITYHPNRGKGYAIKQGMKKSTADYTLFFDADMATPLSELAKFLPHMKNATDVIVGTRRNGKSTIIKHQPFLREFLGRGFTKLSQRMFGLAVSDFTCGFKAFSKQARQTIFRKTIIHHWAADTEMLYHAKMEQLKIAEQPVVWSDQKGSKVHVMLAVTQTIFDLGFLYWHGVLRPYLSNPFSFYYLSQTLSKIRSLALFVLI